MSDLVMFPPVAIYVVPGEVEGVQVLDFTLAKSVREPSSLLIIPMGLSAFVVSLIVVSVSL